MSQPAPDGIPVTVVVATRNRGGRVRATVASVLDGDYRRATVCVVDQSDDQVTERALQEFGTDPRVRYVRSRAVGLARARNLGIQQARDDVIAFTDDDCRATPGWLGPLVRALAADPDIGVVFGNVLAGPHDRRAGFVPAYVRRGSALARDIRDKHRVEGIGACMAVRRAVWQALNGFDEMLGPGAPFRAADDLDLAIRALLAGRAVYETADAVVVHHGFRPWAEGRVLIHDYLFGIGATFAKHLKCGHWSVLHVLRHLALRWALAGPVVDFGHRPSRALRLGGFLRGLAAGAATPVSRRTGHYAGRPAGS